MTPDLARLMLSGRHANVPAAANADIRYPRGSFLGRLSDWLADARARGELRNIPDDAVIALWNGPVQQLAGSWLARPAGRQLSDSGEALAEGAWQALRRVCDRAPPAGGVRAAIKPD